MINNSIPKIKWVVIRAKTLILSKWSLLLGWVFYRIEHSNPKSNRVGEAIEFLKEACKFDQSDSRAYYYLGRCYTDTPEKAFQNYRAAIDKNENDADTWCSIGVLYQLQNQDTDALQAFICAIQITPTHSQAWACLGKLYENHFQYKEALHCYKKSVHHNSRKFRFFCEYYAWDSSSFNGVFLFTILSIRIGALLGLKFIFPDFENFWTLKFMGFLQIEVIVGVIWRIAKKLKVYLSMISISVYDFGLLFSVWIDFCSKNEVFFTFYKVFFLE